MNFGTNSPIGKNVFGNAGGISAVGSENSLAAARRTNCCTSTQDSSLVTRGGSSSAKKEDEARRIIVIPGTRQREYKLFRLLPAPSFGKTSKTAPNARSTNTASCQPPASPALHHSHHPRLWMFHSNDLVSRAHA